MRKEYMLTQQQLAELSGGFGSHSAGHGKGSGSPSIGTVVNVAATLGLDVEVRKGWVLTSFALSTELTLLLVVGRDVPGDIQVVPHGQPLDVPPALITGSVEERDFRVLTEVVDVRSIPGVQRKASASMVNVPVASRS